MLLPRRNVLLGSLSAPLASFVPGLLQRQAQAQGVGKVMHGLAMHGEPKYGPDFQQLEYVDRNAPKGGQLKLAAVGTFDSFNGFIIQGTVAAGIGFIYDPLTTSTTDEAFSEYGLIAESIEMPDDRAYVAYVLRSNARWHDGTPITPADVIFSFDVLKEKGDPFYRLYYSSVLKAEQVEDRKVKFTFDGKPNRELPLIMGQLTVLPKHYWEKRDFATPDLDVPLGSGPYKVGNFQPGRWIAYARVDDYWGKDLPINVGRNNWDTIRYEYYRDPLVSFEAFKAGDYDFRQENSAKIWATGYDIPQVKDGRIVKEMLPDETTQGMQGFILNTRRDIFKDRRVRYALAHAFDFEWTNKALFYDQYTRTKSYWAGGELASKGIPQGEELGILERYRGRVPDEVFTAEYDPPTTDGSGNNRNNLRQGLQILKDAGWKIENATLTNGETGKALTFEILLIDPLFERISQPFIQNLERLGVKARLRTVDTAQYQNRINEFDFDVIVGTFGQSESPGNEQREFWGSGSADVSGSRNVIGVKDPVVDELIELVISADTRESLIMRTHALDRVLLWGHYVVPHWHLPAYRLAYWNKFARPAQKPKFGVGVADTWWIDKKKAEALSAKGTN
jgi:microcin C transport system substrate-binding protein